MSWYEILLFVHIAMAAIWAGGAVMIQFFALRILASGEPVRQVALGADVEWIGNRLLVPASLLAVVSGVLMLIFDMSVKLSFGDLSLGVAVAVAAVLAFLLARHGLSTRVAGEPELAPK